MTGCVSLQAGSLLELAALVSIAKANLAVGVCHLSDSEAPEPVMTYIKIRVCFLNLKNCKLNSPLALAVLFTCVLYHSACGDEFTEGWLCNAS